MDFEEWIAGEMDRGLSQLEVDQMRAAWEAATKAEREACAKICEDHAPAMAWRCASKIRERSNA